MRGVNEIVREGKGHVFALVQLLGGDDAVLLAVQVPSEAFHRDLTCTDAGRPVNINTNGVATSIVCALGKKIQPSKEIKIFFLSICNVRKDQFRIRVVESLLCDGENSFQHESY